MYFISSTDNNCPVMIEHCMVKCKYLIYMSWTSRFTRQFNLSSFQNNYGDSNGAKTASPWVLYSIRTKCSSGLYKIARYYFLLFFPSDNCNFSFFLLKIFFYIKKSFFLLKNLFLYWKNLPLLKKSSSSEFDAAMFSKQRVFINYDQSSHHINSNQTQECDVFFSYLTVSHVFSVRCFHQRRIKWVYVHWVALVVKKCS